jgi:3-methyl-2-oxobutanoate hydroxymethyltransferase
MSMLSPKDILSRKGGERLAMLTAYDYPSAVAVDRCGLDLILVGDSLAEVELGHSSTRAIGLAEMVHHVRAVRRGVSETHVVADMPAGSYEDPAQAVASAATLIEAGGDSVKLEGALVPQVEAIIGAGIPVMGHVGLLPQTAISYRKQGTSPDTAAQILSDARRLDAAGVYAIVIEAVPDDLAAEITAAVGAPTIGIAAGADTDGQVQVITDLLGLLPDAPGHAERRADLFSQTVRAVAEYAEDVRRTPVPTLE